MDKKLVDTVKRILSEDDKKGIAEMLLDPSVDEVVIIYRKDGRLCWHTSCEKWTTIFGAVKMAEMMMEDEWAGQSDAESAEG